MQDGTSTLIPHNFRYCPPSSKLRAASSGAQHVSITTFFIVSNNLLGELMPTKSDNPDALASFRIVGHPSEVARRPARCRNTSCGASPLRRIAASLRRPHAAVIRARWLVGLTCLSKIVEDGLDWLRVEDFTNLPSQRTASAWLLKKSQPFLQRSVHPVSHDAVGVTGDIENLHTRP